MYPGQLREAVMGRIARSEGAPALVAPFHAPGEREIRQLLVQANIAEDGMETLSLGCDGKPLPRPSTVGWVYWGRLFHTALSKIQVSIEANAGQKQGELEYYALRDISAFENIREQFNTCVVERAGADTLAERVAEGKVEQAGYPTPMFADLVRRLAVAGIQIAYESERLTYHFASPGCSGTRRRE